MTSRGPCITLGNFRLGCTCEGKEKTESRSQIRNRLYKPRACKLFGLSDFVSSTTVASLFRDTSDTLDT